MPMPIDRQAVAEAFARCGVGRGDCLMLHADALAAAQMPAGTIEQRMDRLLDGVIDAVGAEGTLVMPTFTYSATKGERFDPARTPSTVGLLTEHFRHRPGVLRSRHPIFSVAAFGRLAAGFAATAIDDCFGDATTFGLLAENNAWLACLGCSLDRVTFVHYVEQAAAVGYRYFKDFRFEIEADGLAEAGMVRYFVRDIDRRTATRLDRLRSSLIADGTLHVAPLGRAQLLCVRAHDFHAAARRLLSEQANALIEEGQEETPT